MFNGDGMLEKHLSDGLSNAQYTSRFSAMVLIIAIDIWIERKLMCSLQESPYFSILADECQDISTQEELSICGRWLVDGTRGALLNCISCPFYRYGTMAEALQSFFTVEAT